MKRHTNIETDGNITYNYIYGVHSHIRTAIYKRHQSVLRQRTEITLGARLNVPVIFYFMTSCGSWRFKVNRRVLKLYFFIKYVVIVIRRNIFTFNGGLR